MEEKNKIKVMLESSQKKIRDFVDYLKAIEAFIIYPKIPLSNITMEFEIKIDIFLVENFLIEAIFFKKEEERKQFSSLLEDI